MPSGPAGLVVAVYPVVGALTVDARFLGDMRDGSTIDAGAPYQQGAAVNGQVGVSVRLALRLAPINAAETGPVQSSHHWSTGPRHLRSEGRR